MSSSGYPEDSNDWTIEVLERMVQDNRGEDTRLEFKSRFRSSRWEGGRDSAVRKEAMAFANRAGGHIVFGITTDEDDAAQGIGEIQEFSSDEDPRQELSQILQSIEPQVDFSVNWFNSEGRGVVVLRIEEAVRPPVLAPGEGTYYRHGESSLPMSADQIRAMFVEFSEREGAIRKLEKELQFFFDACDQYDFAPENDGGPYYEAVNVAGLKDAIRGQHGLWEDEIAKRRLRSINPELLSIEMAENDWKRTTGSNSTLTPSDLGLPGGNDGDGESTDVNMEYKSRLASSVNRIWELSKTLVDDCDLDVEVGRRP